MSDKKSSKQSKKMKPKKVVKKLLKGKPDKATGALLSALEDRWPHFFGP